MYFVCLKNNVTIASTLRGSISGDINSHAAPSWYVIQTIGTARTRLGLLVQACKSSYWGMEKQDGKFKCCSENLNPIFRQEVISNRLRLWVQTQGDHRRKKLNKTHFACIMLKCEDVGTSFCKTTGVHVLRTIAQLHENISLNINILCYKRKEKTGLKLLNKVIRKEGKEEKENESRWGKSFCECVCLIGS